MVTPLPPAPIRASWGTYQWEEWFRILRLRAEEGLTTIAHSSTTGLQGGTTSQYYHLTLAQHTDLTDGGDSTSHYHATDRARANHTGTQTLSTISDAGTAAAKNTGTSGNTVPLLDGTNTWSGIQTLQNNLVFSGTGLLLQADMSNTTATSRFAIQTSTANSNTIFSILPNGTAIIGIVRAYNNSSPTNAAFFQISCSNTSSRLNSGIAGTGTYVPIEVLTSNTVRSSWDINGDFIHGTAALATSATTGFIWIPSCAGTPTGAPTSPYTNAAALIADTTNSRLYVRIGSTWKYAALT